MIKSSTSNLLFTILIFLYPMSQLARLKECFLEKISFKMTLVQGRGHFRWERPFVAPSVALYDSFPPPKSGDKLFEGLTGP